MSDLYEGICNANDGLELIIPTTFEEALTYSQQILWLYFNKQEKLVEGDNITLTDNPDGTVTISCEAVDNPGIKSIVGTVGPTGTQVVVTLTDDTTQSFFVERGPRGLQGETGQQGPEGPAGADGTDGVSPSVSVTSITGGHRVSITDAQGTDTFNVMDGTDGTNGTDGTDGVSPSVSVTTITGGHQVSITDAQGTDTFNVMDGADGATGAQGPAGPGVPTGGTTSQVLAKVNSTDYNTQWKSINEVPSTGTTGNVLTKTANGYGWAAPSGGGGVSTESNNVSITNVTTGGWLPRSIDANFFTEDSSNFISNASLMFQFRFYDGITINNTSCNALISPVDSFVWLPGSYISRISGSTIMVAGGGNTYALRLSYSPSASGTALSMLFNVEYIYDLTNNAPITSYTIAIPTLDISCKTVKY